MIRVPELVKVLLEKAWVVVTALPALLAAVVLAAPILAEEAAKVLPAPWSDRVTALCLTVAAIAAALVQVVRRLTPVVKSARGL